MGPLLQMLHLVNELWGFSNEVNDLVLVALSIHRTHEGVLSGLGQELAHWLNWEVDSHDFAVLLDFYIACVLLEEDVAVFRREWLNQSFYVHQGYAKLID